MKALPKSIAWIWMVVALVAVVGFAAAGCTKLSGTDGTGTSGTTTASDVTSTEAGATTTVAAASTTLAPAGTATTIKVDASEELLSNGHIKACGLIKEVWVAGGVRKIKIDYVDFLIGAEADAAAIADGVIAVGEHVDNDYYVRNKNTKLRTFTVSDSVAITTYSRTPPIDVADAPVSWNTFSDFWNLIGPPLPADMGMSEGLWWIERSSSTGVVLSIEQQWVP
jgi:hypothetical protein